MEAALVTWLQSLGTWGYVLAGLVPVVAYLLRQKFGPKPAPTLPSPETTPANASPRLDAVAPILNALLTALGIAPKGRPATVADVPHDLFMQYGNEWDKLAAIKAAAAAQTAKDLAIESPPAKPLGS